MAQILYAAKTEAAVGLLAATAKSILGIQGAADFGVNLKKFRVGFDGVSATNVPVLVQLQLCTFAGAGTSTATTVQNVAGRANANTGFTSKAAYTAEPTVVTPLDEWLLTPNGGLVIYDFPLGDEPDSPLNQGFVLTLTAPNAVNVRGTFWFTRC